MIRVLFLYIWYLLLSHSFNVASNVYLVLYSFIFHYLAFHTKIKHKGQEYTIDVVDTAGQVLSHFCFVHEKIAQLECHWISDKKQIDTRD